MGDKSAGCVHICQTPGSFHNNSSWSISTLQRLVLYNFKLFQTSEADELTRYELNGQFPLTCFVTLHF